MQIDERYRQFTTAVMGIAYSLQRIRGSALKDYQLNGQHINCIFYLDRFPEGLTPGEITKLSMEDKSSISRSLNLLRERGFVTGSEQNGHKYKIRYVLTEKGKEAAGVLQEKIREAVEAGGRTLSADERTIFYNALGDVNENLRNYTAALISGI